MAPLHIGAVDELCRLALRAQRLGCRVRLEETTVELRALLALAGVDALLLADQPAADENEGHLP